MLPSEAAIPLYWKVKENIVEITYLMSNIMLEYKIAMLNGARVAFLNLAPDGELF